MRKNLGIIIGTFIICLASTCVVCAESSVIPYGKYKIRNANSGLYLDCENLDLNGNLQQKFYQSWLEPQNFEMLSFSNGDYVIFPEKEEHFAISLDDTNQNNVKLQKRNGSDTQKWNFNSYDDGSFRITSNKYSEQSVLSVENMSKNSGAKVVSMPYNSNHSDEWFMEKCIDEGYYFIRNKQTGKYLTVDNHYVCQANYNQSTKQQFKITSSDNGYYDIVPLYNEDLSVEINQWSTGNCSDGTYITVDYGQSGEGQRWKFMLNYDGSIRIVSEMAELKKSLCVQGQSKYVQLYTYDSSKNANWELIRVEPIFNVTTYPSESRHLKVDDELLVELSNRLSRENWIRFLNNMDNTYDAYIDLVGKDPLKKQKALLILTNNINYPACANIPMKQILIKTTSLNDLALEIENNEYPWIMLHEIGHLFDIEHKWDFDGELTANLYLAYALNTFNGHFKIEKYNRTITDYNNIIKIFGSYCSDSYYNIWEENIYDLLYYHGDWFEYILLDTINKTDAWIYFKDAFKYITDNDIYVETNLEKYNYLIETIDKNSGYKFKSNLLQDYSNEISFAKSWNFTRLF